MDAFNKNYLIWIMVAIVILAGLGYWYWSASRRTAPEPIKTPEDVIKAVSAPALEVPSNPAQNKIPELNPIDRANPFNDAYKNPFE